MMIRKSIPASLQSVEQMTSRRPGCIASGQAKILNVERGRAAGDQDKMHEGGSCSMMPDVSFLA